MLALIGRIVKAFFWIFFLLVTMPTLLFLVKSYYSNLITKKTYVGIVELPAYIDRADEIISSAKTLFRAPQIKAVILRADGQGGNAGACQALYEDLMVLKKAYQKPLLAYCQRSCEGGSYLVATAADGIITSSATRIERLGVFDGKCENNTTIAELAQEDYWKTIHATRPHARHVECTRVLTGKECKELGLVDSLGGTSEIEHQLRLKAVIEGRIEEVRGSLIEHFVLSVTSILSQVVKTVRQAWVSVSPIESATSFLNF